MEKPVTGGRHYRDFETGKILATPPETAPPPREDAPTQPEPQPNDKKKGR